MSVHGARVAVSSRGGDSCTGSAYVSDGTAGEQLLKLVAAEAVAFDAFGYSVAVSADRACVAVGAFTPLPLAGWLLDNPWPRGGGSPGWRLPPVLRAIMRGVSAAGLHSLGVTRVQT